MSTFARSSLFYNNLPYIKSVKPFFQSTLRKYSQNSSTAFRYRKKRHKRSVSEAMSLEKDSSLTTSMLLKKLAPRPGSPITVPTPDLNYKPASKVKQQNEKLTKSVELPLKKIKTLIESKQNRWSGIEKRWLNSKSSICRNNQVSIQARKIVNLSNSKLADCPSNSSLDYFIPKYKLSDY
jgi:hypothetical protein